MTIISALIFVSLLSPQNNLPAIGVIVEATGDVVVVRGAKREPARLADSLYPGDQIVTTTGQASFFFCPSSEKASIKNGARVELNANAIVTRGGAAPTKVPARCSLPKVALGAENMEHVGGMRARGNPPITIFLGGPISTPFPTFEWVAVSGTMSYRLILNDDNGNALWEQTTSASSLVYPQSMPALKPGSYQWEVRAERDGKIIADQSATFDVKPNADLAKPAAPDAASRLAHAFQLEDAGYYAEAAADYRAVQKAYPNDTRFKQRLTWLYWNSGLIAAANDLLDKK